MKICKECNKEKEDDKFELVVSPLKHGGNGKQYRRGRCFACRGKRTNSTRKEYRKEYNAVHKDKKARRAHKIRNEVRLLLNELKSNPCVDCNKTFLPIAMDFDHIKDKIRPIARMLSTAYKIELILEEIKKCELVCANCHRIRTRRRLNNPGYSGKRLDLFIDKFKSETPCMICNLNFLPECMDFDHRNPKEKKFEIELMRRYAIKNMNLLLEEMAKCDILCACCHRIKTHTKKDDKQP